MSWLKASEKPWIKIKRKTLVYAFLVKFLGLHSLRTIVDLKSDDGEWVAKRNAASKKRTALKL